ncbi:MAG: thioredoxin-like domain-containing protein [Lacunisphaera sp.]|nr:thioredoxin-like domain-containing protein [Lacunisphaera sp.]
MKLIPLLFAAVLTLPGALPALTMEELAQQPEHWPAQVTVTSATKGTVIKNGQPAGMMLVGAGKQLTVSAIAADGVTGKFSGTTVRVPVKQTDLLKQLAAASITIEEPEPAAEEAAPASPPSKPEPKKPQPKKPAAAPVAAAASVPVPPPAAAAGELTPIQRRLAGRLVRWDKGGLKTYDARQLNGVKYYGVMFSAGWCGPCRQFAPMLLEQYRQLKKAYPEFELVLYSWDNSAGEMASYMSEEAMPWPALKYADREDITELAQLAGPGIPCLVLIDANGKVLAHSFKGDDYLGPGVVLDKAWQVLRKNRGG